MRSAFSKRAYGRMLNGLERQRGGTSRGLRNTPSFRGRVERGIADLSGTILIDLPETREEVGEIGRVAGSASVLLIGRDATEAALRKERLDEFRAPYLAVHRFTDTWHPKR